VLAQAHCAPRLANVKIIGPLRRNIGLVNVLPELTQGLQTTVVEALRAIPVLDEVRVIDRPTRLIVKAGPALAGDPAGRHWVARGRLAPDFAAPIEVEWRPSLNGRLRTFHVVDAEPL